MRRVMGLIKKGTGAFSMSVVVARGVSAYFRFSRIVVEHGVE